MNDQISVTASYLQSLWESEDPEAKELEKFFIIDDSIPFNPKLILKPNVRIVSEDRGVEDLGLALDLFNWGSRKRRKSRYEEFIRYHHNSPRMVSEGDSWFQHPLVTDTIDHLLKYYPVYSVGAAGDTLRNMHYQGEWINNIQKIHPKVFLLSAGGNDILGTQFAGFLVDYSSGYPAGDNPERFLHDRFFLELEALKKLYQDIFKTLEKDYPELPILVHGYDYVIPNNPNVSSKWYQSKDKSWLGKHMIERGITDQKDKQAIIKSIIDLFNANLIELEQMFDHVHYVDLRNMVRDDQWHDEIHPNKDGYQQIALKFREKIHDII